MSTLGSAPGDRIWSAPQSKSHQTPLPCASTHIRLLDLYPPEPDSVKSEATLNGRLFLTPVDSPSPFKALSYTWGTSGQTHSIYLSDIEVKITATLDKAMRYLRHPTEVVTLWIDQVCIDQDNDHEKNDQIPLMGKIYSSAEEVLVWLGPAADGSDKLMDIFARVGEDIHGWGIENYCNKDGVDQLRKIALDTSDTDDQKIINFQTIRDKYKPVFDNPILDAMVAFYKRPWFFRVWVVQEFGLGLDTFFVCGQKRVRVELVEYAILVFLSGYIETLKSKKGDAEYVRRYQCLLTNNPTSAMFSARRRRRGFETGTGPGAGLFELLKGLYVGNKVEATDPRDRIFGILSLANDTCVEKLDIRADYTNPSRDNLVQLYTSTARKIVQDNHLEVLSFSQFPKTTWHLPSWMPGWLPDLQDSLTSVPDSPTDYERPLFSASADTQPQLEPVDDERILALRGFVVDEVDEVGGDWLWDGYEEFPYHSCLSHLEEIRLMCMESAARNRGIYPDSQRQMDALWRVPVGDLEQTDRIRRRIAAPQDAAYAALLALCKAMEAMKAMKPSEEISHAEVQDLKRKSEESRWYCSRMGKMCNKRSYLSKSGYVGLGPLQTCPGDLIVILLGAHVPYVLRPSGARKFFLLGDTYCDGMMDGEIFSRGAEEEIFFLM
ncbi:heterokaryon incompatibility protein-domain-containing protein [Phaeosphaeriaceae sp. PMI808]|nr:heterokaryon incompatibility protein-domain-containing protein [Phaeosphaeriaceae sp. PMI808]